MPTEEHQMLKKLKKCLEAGVVSVDDDDDANVEHDEEVARAVALEEHMASNTLVVTTAVTAAVPSTSTSTTSSSRMKLNIHLQDTTQKFRATAASGRREEVTRGNAEPNQRYHQTASRGR